MRAFLKGPPLGDSASKLETISAVEYSARSRRSNSEALLFAASGAHCLACGATVRGGGYARGRYRRTPEQAALRLRCVRLKYVEGRYANPVRAARLRHSMATLRVNTPLHEPLAERVAVESCKELGQRPLRGQACGVRNLLEVPTLPLRPR